MSWFYLIVLVLFDSRCHVFFFFFIQTWPSVCSPQSPPALLWICSLRIKMTPRSLSSGASQRLWAIPAWTDTLLKSARMEVSLAPLLTWCWLLAWAPAGVRVFIHLNVLHVIDVQTLLTNLLLNFRCDFIATRPCCCCCLQCLWSHSVLIQGRWRTW